MTKTVIYNEKMYPVCIVDLSDQAFIQLEKRQCFSVCFFEAMSLNSFSFSNAESVVIDRLIYQFAVERVRLKDKKDRVILVALGDEFEARFTPPLPHNSRTSDAILQQQTYNQAMHSLLRCLESV